MALKDRGEEWKEYDDAVRWMLTAFFICLGLSVVLFVTALPLSYVVGNGVSKGSMDVVSKFMHLILSNPDHLFKMYGKWFRQIMNHSGSFSLSLWIPLLPFIIIPVGLIFAGMISPYRFQTNIHGSARVATLSDIKKMPLLGFDGFCQVVGKFNGQFLMLKETLATLCCAPPGTGKTAGVVVPTIFNSDKLSLVINDPKPELCYSTSGARAKVGPVLSSTGVLKIIRVKVYIIQAGIRSHQTAFRKKGLTAICTSIPCAIFWLKTRKAALIRTGHKPAVPL